MAVTPLRLLFVTPFIPRRGHDAGSLLMAEHILGLRARGHAVRLVAFFRTEEERADLAPLVPLLERADTFLARQNRGARDPFFLLPVNFRHPEVEAAIQAGMAWAQAAVFEFADVGHLLPAHQGIPAVLVHHEEQTGAWLDYARLAPWWSLEKPLHLLRAARAWRLERWLLRRFDLVIALSERDRDALAARCAGARLAVSKMGVELGAGSAAPGRGEPGRLLYVGYFGHRPNRDAARFLVQEVLPRLRDRVPQVALTLAGSEPEGIADLAGPAVELTGQVPDLMPYYERAQAVVAPILTGRGIRRKVLEAMAAGLPVVTTALGASGIPARHGEHLLLAETAADFADGAARILSEPELARKLSDGGRRLAESFTWEHVIAGFEDLILGVVAKGKR